MSDKPTTPCHACGSKFFWKPAKGTDASKSWICARCHPNPEAEIITLYSNEVLALRDRVVMGNDKLITAWAQISKTADPAQFTILATQWDEANLKLNGLCQQLMLMGYDDCLYIKDGKKTRSCLNSETSPIGCYVCPSKIKYWVQEFEKLP